MLNKKILMLTMVLVSLLAISAVSAADNATSDVVSVEETTDTISVDESDEIVSVEDNQVIEQTENDKTVGAETDSEILSTGEKGNYTDLRNDIINGGILTKSTYYYRDGDGDTILITDSMTIDGKGAVIDMAESTNMRAFLVRASGVIIKNLTIKNAKYEGDGGAIYFINSGTVTNCNFTNNTVAEDGGAVYFEYDGTVTDCNFIDNSATDYYSCGGAVYFEYDGTVTNCNFTNNTADYGGAVYFNYEGTVTNCNFADNIASGYYAYGGAIYFNYEGTVTNCNFAENIVSGDYAYGGAILFGGSGTVENCNFTNNVAFGDGGAILFAGNCNVVNCKFTGNNATSGSAIYFWDNTATETVSNSIFLNNRADSKYIKITPTENNITITFTGKDNLLNAIYSECDVSFTNVTYWGANGIANTGSSPTILSKSNKEAGQNITVVVFVNDILMLNETKVTDDDGKIVFDKVEGNYKITARHDADSYYTELERNLRLTNDGNTYSMLSGEVGDGGNIKLNYDYYYYDYGDAIEITTENSIIDGNGAIIDMAGSNIQAFLVTASNATFKNLTIKNVNFDGDGGAIYFSSSGTVENCNFIDNSATDYYSCGGAVYFDEGGTVINCNFTNNTASSWGWGGAIYMFSGTVINCNFTNNAAFDGGAINMFSGTVENCNFTNNTADYGGAVFSEYECTVINCNFTGNNATIGSAIFFYGSSATNTISNSIFLNNRADVDEYNPIQIVKNDNTIEITFMGQNNLINAIYSGVDGGVDFINVTYWGANGITNTGNSTTTISISNRESGQNISVIMIVNDVLVLNETKVTDENGTIVLDVVAGNSTVTARHDVDSYYTQAQKTQTFSTEGTETSLELSASEFNVTAIISPDDIVGNITFTVENEFGIVKTLETAISNGTAELNLSDLAGGEYNITATYGGSIQYYPAEASLSYQKVNLDVYIDVVADAVTYGENVIVRVTGTAPGYYTVTVNNITEELLIDTPGMPVNVDFGVLGAGNYNINVSYAETANYNAAVNDTETVTVSKASTEIVIASDLIRLNVDDEVGSGASLTPADEGDLTYTSSNETVAIVENGKIIALAEGTAVITVSYAGNDNYSAAEDKAIAVQVAEMFIEAYDVDMIYEDGSAYMVQLIDKYGNPIAKAKEAINITTHGRSYIRYTNASGIAKVTIHLNASSYPATAQYGKIIVSNMITVHKLPIVASDVNMVYRDGSAYMVQLVDVNGNPFAKSNQAINITIAGKTYTRYTNASGVAKITINLAPGTYQVTAQYGDNIVNNVVTVNRYGIIASDVDMTYKDGSAYRVQLVDGNGDPVAKANVAVNITIDGRTYTRVTDANGVAKVTINLRAGEYPVTAQYGNVIIENMVTVNNQYSISASDLVMTYRDGSAFEVQLLDQDGNPCALAKEPVKITVAGKTYTRSTDENGIAKIVINLAAGTYPVTTEYNNKTLSNTITVNKT